MKSKSIWNNEKYGLTLEEITTRFAKSDIIIKDESQEVSVDEYKRAMASKSTKISLNKPKPKLQLKPKAPAKIISSTTESSSLITQTTQEDLDRLRPQKTQPQQSETKKDPKESPLWQPQLKKRNQQN